MSRSEQKIITGWEFAYVSCKPRWIKAADYGLFDENGPEEYALPADLKFAPIRLPHDWAVNAPFNKQMEQGAPQGFRDRWGIGWYRKTLEIPKKKQAYTYYLDFGGVYENCTVWVNETYVGRQRYGYSSFKLDVTEAVVSGENRIVVKVDNSNAPADRWYSGCGIYRTVKLIEVEEKHLEPWDVVVETEIQKTEEFQEAAALGEKEVLQVAPALVKVNAGLKASVRGVLHGLGVVGAELISESADGILTFEVPDAKLWSAENPNLYELTLSLLEKLPGEASDSEFSGEERIADQITLRIGIRKVEFDPKKGMLVNGIPTKLKGVCLHQDGGCVGNAVHPAIWRERLENLKEMGCNAIRGSHHTFASEFLDLCDEMGFYVYEECFDKWTSGLYGRYFKTQWQSDVDAMVKRDRNRPSIVIWGVGNEVENQAQKSMLDILRMLREYVRSLDASRPVSCAMNPHFGREKVDLSQVKDIQKIVDEASSTEIFDAVERVERIKLIAEIVDMIACNYQEQWYDLIHEMIPDKLILGTEVYQYFHGHYDQMQNFVDKNPNLVPFEKDYCIGSFIWTGYDYLGESMGYPAKGWSGAPIRTNHERRPSYYMLQSFWSEKPMVHFSVMDYSLMDEGGKEHWDIPIYVDHWHFPQFRKTVIPYVIATNCEEVVLDLNGKKFYLPKPADCPNHMITGFLPWQPGTVKVTGLIGGKEVCSHVTVTPGPAADLKFDKELVKLQSKEIAGHQMLLTVRACDLEGNFCFRECARVRFRVEGPAKLLAVDSGDITGNEPYNDDFVHLYHGSASVLVELTGEPGRVAVWADGDGLRSGETVIVVR